MRFHVINLPHTQTTKEYVACAYTQKALNFCKMMMSLGHEVFLYASEENDAPCTELITIASKEAQREWFGEHDFRNKFFNITWAGTEPHWRVSNQNAIDALRDRLKPRDFICIIGGTCQQPIAKAYPAHMSVEYGIGYTGVFSPYKVFESYAHMHWVYGKLGSDDGKFYDCVIPNYFDLDDFEFSDTKEDYYLWMGRFIPRKGPDIAVEVTRRLGAKLIMAGQGVNETIYNNDGTTTLKGDGIEVTGDHIEHIGHVDVAQRSQLMAKAKATFMATTYLEPFGGVSIESLMSGTPVIATDFGAFPENIVHGKNGYRFRTIGEATQFASQTYLDKLDSPIDIRGYAARNFSLHRVKFLYEDYFRQLLTLWEEGFYTKKTTSDTRYSRFL